MKIYKNLTELVGRTPLLELGSYGKDLEATVLAKLERMNPGGSAKDRVAMYMIKDAEEKGLLKEGGTIIEPTSGNTGIGLAALATAKGYKAIIVMPDTMSVERINLIKAYGAEVILTEGVGGMAASIAKAEELARDIESAWIAGQFENSANATAHRETTGPEIWEDTDGKVDIYVASVGTGGTLTGAGEYLKSKNPNIKVVAVEPASSPLLSGGQAAPHKIQGIGANFIPAVLNREIYDEVITVTDEEAFAETDRFAKTEGIVCGISSGAALAAAVKLAKREENKGKNIVVVLPDTGERYLSTGVFK